MTNFKQRENAIMITMSTIAAAAVKRNHNQFQMTEGIAQQKYTAAAAAVAVSA